jgi:hypothetical protein
MRRPHWSSYLGLLTAVLMVTAAYSFAPRWPLNRRPREVGKDGPVTRYIRKADALARDRAAPSGFHVDVDRDGKVTDWDAALLSCDHDSDGDIDLFDWSAWSGNFKVPSATVAVPLEHCRTMDGAFTRVYRMQHSCPSGPLNEVDPNTETWISTYPWPLQLRAWQKYHTGPRP